MAKQTINIGTAANAGDGEPLRDAFDKINDNFDEIYNTSSGSEFVTTDKIRSDAVDSDQIASGAIDEDHLNATNSPTAGHMLTYDSGGGFTWALPGDITGIVAGDGLTGDAASGEATINLVNATNGGLQVNSNDVRIDLNDLSAAGVDVAVDSIAIIDVSNSNGTRKETIADLTTAIAGTGLTASNGVINRDSIDTDDIAANAINGSKLEQFDDTLTAATSGDIIVSNGTDFIHATMSGDATIASGGALTIASDSIDYTKLADEFTTVDALSGTAVDWSAAQVFTKTLSANTTLTFSNVSTGMVKDLVISGNYTLTLPSSVKTITGTYDGSTTNLIQLVSTNGSTEQWATISQEAS